MANLSPQRVGGWGGVGGLAGGKDGAGSGNDAVQDPIIRRLVSKGAATCHHPNLKDTPKRIPLKSLQSVSTSVGCSACRPVQSGQACCPSVYWGGGGGAGGSVSIRKQTPMPFTVLLFREGELRVTLLTLLQCGLRTLAFSYTFFFNFIFF